MIIIISHLPLVNRKFPFFQKNLEREVRRLRIQREAAHNRGSQPRILDKNGDCEYNFFTIESVVQKKAANLPKTGDEELLPV